MQPSLQYFLVEIYSTVLSPGIIIILHHVHAAFGCIKMILLSSYIARNSTGTLSEIKPSMQPFPLWGLPSFPDFTGEREQRSPVLGFQKHCGFYHYLLPSLSLDGEKHGESRCSLGNRFHFQEPVSIYSLHVSFCLSST